MAKIAKFEFNIHLTVIRLVPDAFTEAAVTAEDVEELKQQIAAEVIDAEDDGVSAQVGDVTFSIMEVQ